MNLLGVLGASVGFGIVQAFQIISSQALGVTTGEWKHASRPARKAMFVSVVFMMVAVIVIASAKGIR